MARIPCPRFLLAMALLVAVVPGSATAQTLDVRGLPDPAPEEAGSPGPPAHSRTAQRWRPSGSPDSVQRDLRR